MRSNKMKSIGTILNQSFDHLLDDLYIKQQMSSQEISDYIFKHSNILITVRSIQRQLKKLNLTRGLIRHEIMRRDGFRCVLCGQDASNDRLEVDHIIPVVAGGTNDIKNLRTLCSECNKGKMLLEEREIIAI